MTPRVGIAFVLLLLAAAPASAQVIRFDTTAGEFDMVLNPTNDPVLQGHVDNMLQYVKDHRYDSSWINRADTGFVLQMGGFYSHTRRPPPTIDSTRNVVPFGNLLEGEPAAETGLSNTIGTVAMALPGSASGGTNQDGGTSSFFVNLTDNNFLDADFTVFAAIPDMTVVNKIMALTTIDRTTDSNFGAGDGNLAFSDVPVKDDGFQVFIKRTFIINDTLAVARAMAGVQSLMARSALGGSAAGASLPQLVGNNGAVPEPATAIAAMIAALALSLVRNRRCDWR